MLHSGCVKLHQKFRDFVGLPMGLLREESPKNRMNTGLFGSRSGEPGFNLGLLVLIHLALVSAIAYTIWGLLLSVNPVSKIGVYMCVTPIIGVILSSVVLHESNQAFQLSSLIALLLVSLSVFLVNKETQTD